MCQRLIILMVILTLVGGCGGGSNDSSESSTNSTNLPHEPGDEGKSTLQGIDSDNDGVRDDVQIAIYERYSSDKNKRKALTQKAEALQEAIIAGNSSNSDTINQAASLIINAVDCLHEKVDDPSSEIGFLEQKMINTLERSESYIKFNEALNGRFFGDDDTNSSCQ